MRLTRALRRLVGRAPPGKGAAGTAIRVPVSRILRSGENGIPASQYARLTGTPLRGSTGVAEGPHVKLLRDYRAEGERLFEAGRFEQTAYYRNAVECIAFTGRYFSAYRREAIVDVARNFAHAFCNDRAGTFPADKGHSEARSPIVVRPIAHSDCYELVDGNHRLAHLIVSGESEVEVLARGVPATTAAQDLLLDVLWQGGRLELYQPMPLPEVARWQLVRRCDDRLRLMTSFLAGRGLLEPSLSFLDIGCSYGWFVAQMARRHGIRGQGVDRDPFALAVGRQLYGIPEESLVRSNITDFLMANARSFDMVCLFSVLHHFVLNKEAISAVELMGLVERATARVLFIDTGQGTEAWFAESLKEWTPEFIAAWLRENTGFSTIVALGRDTDNVGPFKDNYGRTLFACTR